MYSLIIMLLWSMFYLPWIQGAVIPDFWKSDFFNIYRHAAIETRKLQDEPVERDSVTYYLYTIDNPDNYTQVYPEDLSPLAATYSKLAFIIHGWGGDREGPWYEDIKNAFFLTYGGNYSVVEVDWGKHAKQFYYVASINTYDVAKYIAELIVNLNQNYSVSFDNILLIGHSLGGQTAGFIGKHVFKMTDQKLPRIIALDPAGPLFDTRPDDKRLNENDAKVVEVIHTDGGTFGFKEPCGTIDFFPNGGSSQPGCKTIDLLDLSSVPALITCDHGRAVYYFIEALLNPRELVARRCKEWGNLISADDCEDVEVPIGDLTTTLTGKFYLETNKERPYSRSLNDRSGSILASVPGANKVLSVLASLG